MKKVIENIPIHLFCCILLFTNIIGLALLLFGPIEYWKVSYVFCGYTLPDVYVSDLVRIILVTCAPLVSITISYHIGKKLSKKVIIKTGFANNKSENNNAAFFHALLWGAFFYVLIKIFNCIDLKDISSWLNNNEFYRMRRLIMDAWNFFDFVMVYSILPLLIGICYCTPIKGKRFNLLFVIEILMYIFCNIYIFQKRPLIVGLFYILVVIVINNISLIIKWNFRKIALIVILGISAMYLIYATGITLNTLEEGDPSEYLISSEKANLETSFHEGSLKDTGVVSKEENTTKIETETKKLFRTYELKKTNINLSKFCFTQLMACVGMLNRTAYATIVDVIIYPEYHDFYPIDLGLDIIGIGSSPDENLVTAQILYSGAESAGATPVPFYVTLYTQGGIIVSIVGSILVGFCMGFFWIQCLKGDSKFRKILGAWIAVFAITIAINSGRNALLATDGVFWPMIFVVVIYGANLILKKGELR